NIGFKGTVDFNGKLEILKAERVLVVVWINETIAKQAWSVFEQFNTDKQWSFTDCTSCVLMKQAGITEVFEFDHHFDQMGFTCKP
ncbi:MAG: hypothetical protein ABII26_07040, partial [Pseudomonadota bacterium]